MAKLAAAIQEDRMDISMLMAEVRHDPLKFDLGRVFGQGKNAMNRVSGPLIAAGMERAQQHARVVGMEIDAGSADREPAIRLGLCGVAGREIFLDRFCLMKV
jgi:hypothetical protein